MESKQSKKLFLVAGERSGDLHCSNLISALKKHGLQPCEFVGWGGELSQKEGMRIIQHYKHITFMGIWQVLTNLFKIKAFLKQCKQQILEEKPNAVVLIDFGGFNMKIAQFCKKRQIPVHYYISPKVWAWNTKRAHKLKRDVDYMYSILPFELDFFKTYGLKADYVGNPVCDAVNDYLKENPKTQTLKEIAILPGSRKSEVSKMLSIMASIAPRFPGYTFTVTAVDNLPSELYQPARDAGLKVVYDQTYQVLNRAEAALVTSGTATLETGLFRVPQVVCFKVDAFNYRFAKLVLKVKYISLINLIANKEAVKELIQDQFNHEAVSHELSKILTNTSHKNKILEEYDKIIKLLSLHEASQETARLIWSRI